MLSLWIVFEIHSAPVKDIFVHFQFRGSTEMQPVLSIESAMTLLIHGWSYWVLVHLDRRIVTIRLRTHNHIISYNSKYMLPVLCHCQLG